MKKRHSVSHVLPLAPSQWPSLLEPYDVVYADPAWPYRDKAQQRGGATRHYETMDLADICALPVASIVADRAVLFLWGTAPNMPMVREVMEAWGFEFRTKAFSWIKTNGDGTIFRGMGHYTRANTEDCWLGVRGKPLPRLDKSIAQAQLHPRGRHSAKPAAFRRDIERLYGPDVRRVELFSRDYNAGWDMWGNEVPSGVVEAG